MTEKPQLPRLHDKVLENAPEQVAEHYRSLREKRAGHGYSPKECQVCRAVSKLPTKKAVLDYADRLRVQAEQQMVADVYAKPYWPTTAYAEKLYTEHGPEGAIEYLKARVAHADGEARRDAQEASHSLKRLQRRKKAAKRDRDAERAGMTPGARIDQALASLATLSAVPAARVGAEPKSSNSSTALPFADDLRGRGRRVALDAARSLEEMVEQVRVRDMERAA